MNTKKAFKFTDDQQTAISAIKEFATEMFSSTWFYTFTGPAGSGKTACMMEVQRVMRNAGLKIVFTAPTNKAAKVLRKVVGEAQTTYTFLNLRVMPTGEVKSVLQGKAPDLSQVDILVVDEASMVNKVLFRYLEEEAKRWKFKVVFMGDAFQLPPVNEDESFALRGDSSSRLTEVVRHDNQILDFATEVRNQIEKDNPRIKLRDDNDGEEGVFLMDDEEFQEVIYHAAQEGHFSDGETAKVVAWRNVQVGHYNHIIRHAIYGDKAKPGYFLLDERISVGSPAVWNEVPLMATDEGGVILDIEQKRHPYMADFHVFELSVEREDSPDKKPCKLYAIHPESKDALDDYFTDLAYRAKTNKSLWKQFWEEKELFHDVRYGYAETAHKSQGSTYRDVYVDHGDIMRNKNKSEAFRCFYVATTRPTTRLILVK